jgi:hypothetical protein
MDEIQKVTDTKKEYVCPTLLIIELKPEQVLALGCNQVYEAACVTPQGEPTCS